MPETSNRRDGVVRIMEDSTSHFILAEYAAEALDALAAHGYVIVHPDDVPERDNLDDAPVYMSGDEAEAWMRGWNACRAHIFGEEA